MRHSIPLALTRAFIVAALLGGIPRLVVAQDASPPAGSAAGGDVAASGLTNPRGFTWDADGTLYVALAGNGGATDATPTPAGPAAADGTPSLALEEDVLIADDSGAVVRIEDGRPVVVADGLPSYLFIPLNWADGVIDVAFLAGTLYALVDGGGEAVLHPDEPNGVYRIDEDGATTLIADLSAWFRANPVAEPTGEVSPDGQPFAMVANEQSGLLWITEANHEQLLTVDPSAPDGAITRMIDLSPSDVVEVGVPTGLALAPGGGAYVGFLTAEPYVDGAAKVVHVAADGSVTDVWTGLTAVTDIALGPDGALYATELSTGNADEAPFYRPGSGRVVRQTGPDSHEEVAAGLDYPVHLGFGPDGGLYVATPAIGANGGEGVLLRLDQTPPA
jgi:sugar lactone lactonase YvrE